MLKKVFASTILVVVICYSIFSAEVDKTYSQLKMLLDILNCTKDSYVEEVEPEKLIYGACRGMVAVLDPFSQFLEPQIYKELKVETEGQFGGLGIRITIRDGWVTVISPIPETPAYRLGILPGDKIIKIDGETTQGITIEEAVQKLRGQPGTKVTVTISREGLKEPVDYTITREMIKIPTLRAKMLEKDIGYIRLYEFNNNTEPDLKKALLKLSQQGMKKLIFDLRNNPGGLLDVAVKTCKLFIGNNKLIVYTEGRTEESKRKEYAGLKAPYGSLPLLVLVNRGSASGSEIVAGALQDHRRAIIVGSQTFGKASVQSIIPLEHGCALRLTTAKYYTPSGRCIHRDDKTKACGGITPDVIIEVSPEQEAKLQMQEVQEMVEPGPGKENEKKERVRDVVLERAIELFNAREVFLQLKEE